MPTSTKVYQIKLWDAQIHSELRWLCWNSSTSSEWNGRTPSTFLSSTPGWSVHKTVTVSQDSGQPVRARIWEIYIFQRLKLGGRQERRRVLGQSPIFLKSGRILRSAAPPVKEQFLQLSIGPFSNQLWILSFIDEGSHCVIKLINLGFPNLGKNYQIILTKDWIQELLSIRRIVEHPDSVSFRQKAHTCRIF